MGAMSNLPQPPAHLARYVEALGVDQTIEFLLNFGGADLHVSRNPRPSSRIVAVLGGEAARRLFEVCDTYNLPRRVPLGKRWIAQVLFAQGNTIASIARRLHVSDTAVRGYTRAQRSSDDPRQMSFL